MATNDRFDLAERIAMPLLMRGAEAIAIAIGDAPATERLMGRLPVGVRYAVDALVMQLGSIPQFSGSHVVNDLARTFSNKLGERLRVQVTRVTPAEVKEDLLEAYHQILTERDQAMAAINDLQVVQVEGEAFFRIEGCPTTPAAGGGGRKGGGGGGKRRTAMKLDHAEGALGLLVHPGCAEFCIRILKHEKDKAASAAEVAKAKLAGIGGKRAKRSWVEHCEGRPDLLQAAMQNIEMFFPDEAERNAALELMEHDCTSVAEVEAVAAAGSKAQLQIVLRGIKERSLGSSLRKLGRDFGEAAKAVREAFGAPAPATPAAPVAPVPGFVPVPPVPVAPASAFGRGQGWLRGKLGF